MIAADLRALHQQLTAERLEAAELGLADNQIYMAELEDEIEEVRRAYVIAAVTEIASLRGQLTGVAAG